MLSSRRYTEKRDYIRMELGCPVQYSDVSGLRVREGTCLNLSAKGIAFEATEEFPIGAKLTVHVSPKLAVTPPFSATVKIVRTEPLQNKKFKLAGLIEEVA